MLEFAVPVNKHKFSQSLFSCGYANSQNSIIKFSILSKKVVEVCLCEGGTAMKKQYTEAQIANALGSVGFTECQFSGLECFCKDVVEPLLTGVSTECAADRASVHPSAGARTI